MLLLNVNGVCSSLYLKTRSLDAFNAGGEGSPKPKVLVVFGDNVI